MELWGEANADWLAGFLGLPHGIPSQDVALSVFASIDPRAFSAVFSAWAQLLRLRLEPAEKDIAIDGKTGRRSFDTAKNRPPIHAVKGNQPALGQDIEATFAQGHDERPRSGDQLPRPVFRCVRRPRQGTRAARAPQREPLP
jgi:hypothetical protein